MTTRVSDCTYKKIHQKTNNKPVEKVVLVGRRVRHSQATDIILMSVDGITKAI